MDANQTAKIITELVEVEGIESLAVCLLPAYRNPRHEQAVAEISAKLYPSLPKIFLNSSSVSVKMQTNNHKAKIKIED